METQALKDVIAERERQISGTACYDAPKPWKWEFWKPTDRRRDLVKAGALILAEIEWLDRAEEANRD